MSLKNKFFAWMRKEIMRADIACDVGTFGIIPCRAHATDAGADMFSTIDCVVPAHGSVAIKTDVRCKFPKNSVALFLPKSGMMMRNDILSFGVVDEPYRGEMVVKLFNLGDEDYHVHFTDKITQMVVLPCMYPNIYIGDVPTNTDRGTNGFGSSGR